MKSFCDGIRVNTELLKSFGKHTAVLVRVICAVIIDIRLKQLHLSQNDLHRKTVCKTIVLKMYTGCLITIPLYF